MTGLVQANSYSEATRRRFRDWVTEHKHHALTIKGAARMLGLSRQACRDLFRWAEKKGLVVEVGPLLDRETGPRAARVWRYIHPGELPPQRPQPKRRPPEHEAITRARNGNNGAPKKKRRIAHKEVRQLVDLALAQGWRVDWENSKRHLKLLPPDGGEAIYGPMTPSDSHSIPNFRASLRRAGADV